MSTGADALFLALLLMFSQAPAKPSDKACLAYTAKREAANQSIRAQAAVVEVVKHRMKQRKASCRAVVAEKHQFSWWHKNLKMSVEQDWLTRVDKMSRIGPVLPRCSSFFYSDDIRMPTWAKTMKLVRKEGRMRFLCDGKH